MKPHKPLRPQIQTLTLSHAAEKQSAICNSSKRTKKKATLASK